MPKAPKAKSTRSRLDPYARLEPSNRSGDSATAYSSSGPEPSPSNGIGDSSSVTCAGEKSGSQTLSDFLPKPTILLPTLHPRPDETPPKATAAAAAAAAAATTTSSQAYLLRANLPTNSPPCISRMLRVPSTLTFTDLHRVLQTAFGWTDSHTYSFSAHTIANKPAKRDPYGPADSTHVMTLEMDETASSEAHMLPQDEGAKMKACSDVKLRDVFEKAEWRPLGVTVTYLYDFEEGCEHSIQFLGPAEPHLGQAMGLAEQQVFCFGGEGHPCIEDCGSYGEFEELKELFRNSQLPDPQGRREWYMSRPGNSLRGLDPRKWDIAETNRALEKLQF